MCTFVSFPFLGIIFHIGVKAWNAVLSLYRHVPFQTLLNNVNDFVRSIIEGNLAWTGSKYIIKDPRGEFPNFEETSEKRRCHPPSPHSQLLSREKNTNTSLVWEAIASVSIWNYKTPHRAILQTFLLKKKKMQKYKDFLKNVIPRAAGDMGG